MSNQSYGHFCPLALASEVLCSRWTLLIIKEILLGANSFNELSRCLPRMSRTLLSSRLKDLVKYGILCKNDETSQHKYRLSEAGEALRPVIFSFADWSQQWLHIEPSLNNVEADHIMWHIRCHARRLNELPTPFVAEFTFPEQKKEHQTRWLVFHEDQIELCIIDQEFDVDVYLECSAQTLTKIWMGWAQFDDSVRTGALKLAGTPGLLKLTKQWLGNSRLAGIEKKPYSKRLPANM